MERVIIVTGFDPFGEDTINPSWEAVKMLPDRVKNFRIVKAMLPTVAYRSTDIVISLIEKVSPEYVISVGQAGGRAAVSLEHIARNINNFRIPDNEGNIFASSKIIEDAPLSYYSSLPIEEMKENILEHGIKCEISESAGEFVCNCLMFTLLHYIKTHALDIKSGFIHVPYIPEQTVVNGKPSMKLEEISLAIEKAIEALS